MNQHVTVARRGGEVIGVGHVPNDQLDSRLAKLVLQPVEICLRAAAAQIVVDDGAVAPLQQSVNVVGADEARAACDKIITCHDYSVVSTRSAQPGRQNWRRARPAACAP